MDTDRHQQLYWFGDLKAMGFCVALGSTFAVVGVALFANWSILSNVTASFILYFTFPYKIGDRIRIHDKDLPVTAVIEDIKGFYTDSKNGRRRTHHLP